MRERSGVIQPLKLLESTRFTEAKEDLRPVIHANVRWESVDRYRVINMVENATLLWTVLRDNPEAIGFDCLNAMGLYYFLRLVEELDLRGYKSTEFLSKIRKLEIDGVKLTIGLRGMNSVCFVPSVIPLKRYQVLSVDWDEWILDQLRMSIDWRADDAMCLTMPVQNLPTCNNADAQNLLILDVPKVSNGLDAASVSVYGHRDGRRRWSLHEMTQMMLDRHLEHNLEWQQFLDVGGMKISLYNLDPREVVDYLATKL